MLIARPLVMKSALQSNQFKTRFFNLIWDHLWTHYRNKNFQKVPVYIKTTCILFWSNKDGFYILFVNCRNVKTENLFYFGKLTKPIDLTMLDPFSEDIQVLILKRLKTIGLVDFFESMTIIHPNPEIIEIYLWDPTDIE